MLFVGAKLKLAPQPQLSRRCSPYLVCCSSTPSPPCQLQSQRQPLAPWAPPVPLRSYAPGRQCSLSALSRKKPLCTLWSSSMLFLK